MIKTGSKKTLLFGNHGFVVQYDPIGFTALPSWNCHHIHWHAEEMDSIRDVIKKVESIRQPEWWRTLRFRNWQISLTKY